MHRRRAWIGIGVTAAIAVLAGALVATPAPAAPAGDQDGGVPAFLLRVDDLSGDYGRLNEAYASNLGRGVLPSSCNPLTAGVRVVGTAAPTSWFSELNYPGPVSWQNTVYTYASSSTARASFDQLRSRTLSRCTGEAFTPYGDDEAFVPNVNANAARALPRRAGLPRFATAASHILLAPGQAPPGYTDNYAYGVFTLVYDAIVQVQAYAPRPLDASARTDAIRASARIAARYAAAG